ncbi:MAG: hypothetical protein RDU20_03155 [Desulfomonilaceae bacterium]|nr:hypothetical protein [Desulfomonilaceae bacterium]
MNLLRMGINFRFSMLVVLAVLLVPAMSNAQEFSIFESDQYGFSMKYPASWIKIDKPKGNYYVVFQSPELTDNFRNRIHVAAHKPVKDPLKVFLQELRNGIKDLQKGPETGSEKQQVKILDEGEFRSEVPGAYYFFIQAYENKLKLWMDIVIVFYKHEDTLLRISCLAPSKSMEQYHALFNTVLVSVKFGAPSAPADRPLPRPEAAPAPAPRTPSPGEVQPGLRPSEPSDAELDEETAPEDETPPTQLRPGAPAPSPYPDRPSVQPAPPPRPGPGPGPRGPARMPERPATGIVN